MKRKKLLKYIPIVLFAVGIALINSPTSFALESQATDQDISLISRSDLTIRASVGYRIDDLDWNIAGKNDFGEYMDKLSELIYNDVEIIQVGLDANLVVDRIYARASIHFGEIIDGQGTDSDYCYDEDRGGLFSPYSISINEIKNDDVLDLSAGIGYQFELLNKSLRIVPLAGVSYHVQNIRMTDGLQVFTLDKAKGLSPPWDDAGTRFEDLNSTYKTQWRSGWFGMDMHYKAMTNLSLWSALEYHIADYESEANWNLRSAFQHPVSFIQEAEAQGIAAKIGIDYAFGTTKAGTTETEGGDKEEPTGKDQAHKPWNIGLTYSWGKWSTDQGTESLFIAQWYSELFGLDPVLAGTLNEVNWESQSLNLSLSYKF